MAENKLNLKLDSLNIQTRDSVKDFSERLIGRCAIYHSDCSNNRRDAD